MRNKYYRLISNIIMLLLSSVLGIFIKLLFKKYKDVWLIAERGYDARDNGFHLYKFINENHPEINIYYVIDYKSADYKKVSQIGRVVEYRSLKHYLLFAISKVKISTHVMGYSPDIGFFKKLDYLGIVRGKKVFLQHGIIKDDLKYLYYPFVKLDLFVCGALPEHQYVSDKYKHNKDVVQYLGLCRYDGLDTPQQNSRQVLLMPTWRSYVGKCNNIEEFTMTDYYEKYQALLNNEDFHKLLQAYDFTLVFYPHFEVQRYLNSFTTNSDCVKIASFDNNDVQKLLKESNLLITDFSSVFFDFAYMRKPQIYYQFDEKEYRDNHYSEGYFSYRDHGFGPVVSNEKDLLNELELILKNDCEITNKYVERIGLFFPTNDKRNCERNFEAIKALM